MKNFYLQNKDFIDKLGFLLLVAGIVFAAVFLMSYVAPFVAGYVISLILSPLVGLLHMKWRIPRGVSAAVLILLTIALIFALGGLLVGRIIDQMAEFSTNIPQYIEGLRVSFDNLAANLGLSLDFESVSERLLAFITGLLQRGAEGGNFLTAIPSAILGIVLAIISAFFFIKDKEFIKAKVVGLFPEKIHYKGGKVRKSLISSLGGYARGQLIIMSLIATICGIGLTVLGSSYSIFAAIGIAVFDIIPIFGAGGILIPWAIFSFIDGNTAFGVGLLVISVACFLARQLLEPRIVGKRIGLHPIVLLMSIYLGITLIGPAGILAGPLVTLLIKIIMETKLQDSDGIAGQTRNDLLK
ncbi:MAG: sporulation integral membrane protein YtvI [Defluviitaleaceae bacterium]|nr:sporulation integral membrane protein YtvI [Defluviitaleaceae bacterium]